MKINKIALASAAVAILAAPSAFADTTQATIITGGTVLQGPGPQYTVLGAAPAQSTIDVQGCLPTHDWCEVMVNGQSGWMRASDLGVTTSTGQVMLSAPTTQTTVSTVTYDQKKVHRDAGAGALAGAAVGAAAGGPIGAVIGAAVGAAGGAAATGPDKTVTTYVTQNPVPAAQIQGNIVVGTVVPSTVTLTPVPQSKYSYIYVDGHPVLVDNQTRTVVRIMG